MPRIAVTLLLSLCALGLLAAWAGSSVPPLARGGEASAVSSSPSPESGAALGVHAEPGSGLLGRVAEQIVRAREHAHAIGTARAAIGLAHGRARQRLDWASRPDALTEVIRRAAFGDCDGARDEAALLLAVPRSGAERLLLHDMAARCAVDSLSHGDRAAEEALQHIDAAREILASAGTMQEDPETQALFSRGTARSPWRALWAARAALALDDPQRARLESIDSVRSTGRHRLRLQARTIELLAALRLPDTAREAMRQAETMWSTHVEMPDADALRLAVVDAALMLGEVERAARDAESFVHAHPERPISDAFRERLEEAVARGAVPRSRSWEERFEQARDVRFSRFRDLAEELLDPLEEEAAAQGRATDANRVRFQRVLNAWEGGRSADGLRHVASIRADGGAGVSDRMVERYELRFLGRLGRGEEGLALLRERMASRPVAEAQREEEEYAFMVGLYREALAAARRWRPERHWTTFDGAFLLYLAGEHAKARDGFAALADRSAGAQARRARYWQARAETRLGNWYAARALLVDVGQSDPFDYHARMSLSRLAELPAPTPAARAGAPGAGMPGGEPDDREDWASRRIPDAPASVHAERAEPSAFARGPATSETEATPEPVQPLSRPARRTTGPPHTPMGFSRLRDVEQVEPAVLERMREHAAGPPGALAAFDTAWGSLFPEAAVAHALLEVGAREEARLVFRDVAEEFRALTVAGPRQGNATRGPLELGLRRDAHRIDNRPQPRGWWGGTLGPLRWPLPTAREAREELRLRHASILRQNSAIRQAMRPALAEVGDAHLVRRFALEAGALHGTPPWEGSLDRWRDAYPPAHAEWVLREAERHDLDPFLLWALMIVESDLNPDSISRADAYGLMQVIPRTGHLTAASRGQVGFGIHALLDPQLSIEAGTWYLAELLAKFDHQETLALVSYNAGPHQVARWLDWRGDGLEMDAFMETIPFERARRYAERILRLTWLYRAIWEEDADEAYGNALTVVYADNIDW